MIGNLSYSNIKLAKALEERKKAEQERLAHLRFFECMDQINRAMQGTNDLERMMSDVLGVVLSIFDCDRAFLMYPCDPGAAVWHVPMERNKPEYPGVLEPGLDMRMDPDVAETLRILLAADGPVKFGPGTPYALPADMSERFGFKCFMAMAIHPKAGSPWQFGIHQCSYARVWTAAEERLLREIGRRLGDALTSILAYRDLQESETKYRRIVDTANEGIWVLGPDEMTNFVNARMAEMVGYQVVEMIGRPLTAFMFEEDAPDHQRRMKARRLGLSEHYERRFRHKDGTTVWTLASATPVFDDEHHFKGAFVMFTDITERRQAEEALKQAEERYRSIFENAVEGIFQSTPEGHYLSANPALARMHGYDSPQDLIASVRDIRHQRYVNPEERTRFQKTIEEHASVKEFVTEEYREDGSRIWVSINARAVRGPDGEIRYYEGTVEDISERKKAEEEIRELNLELEQRVRDRTADLEAANKELEAFAYSVSHDLRAPLRHIDGFVELLQEKTAAAPDEESRHYMSVISNSARKMGVLIDDILSFSRMGRQEMSKTQVDLGNLVQEVIRELQIDAEGRDIHWSIADLPVVTGNRAMLRIVLVNLISNALKFTRSREPAEIEIGCVSGMGSEIQVFVRDNGVGFDMNHADKLFGVFQRLHRADEFEGTGIGLASVLRIITRHGGRTWAEGKVNHGATFYFSLPRT